ncbi:MAG: tail fiber domain-containing protein [Bacteroidetes bacterium]|nr:tail fiber domain-containing protein [Bacteroidota bacterium]
MVSTAMGDSAIASGDFSTAMGLYATASYNASTAMGGYTTASDIASTAMGNYATASGYVSTAIGIEDTASGAISTAMGNWVSTNNYVGSFIIGDKSINSLLNSTAANQMKMRFAGGYHLSTNASGNAGVWLGAGGNSWSVISDSAKKENFRPAPDFLSKIAQMKIGSWNYKGQDKKRYRHYGPMAQEFYAHFGNDGIGAVGNDTTIASADIDGVMMIAIQQLIKENERLKTDNAALKAELTTQKETTDARLSKLEAELSKTYISKNETDHE